VQDFWEKSARGSESFTSVRVEPGELPSLILPAESAGEYTASWPQRLDFFGTPLVIEPSPGQLSSDADLLPIRQFDHRIGLTRATSLV
jgi:hypothetical protein